MILDLRCPFLLVFGGVAHEPTFWGGRVDDNLESIRKRFATYEKENHELTCGPGNINFPPCGVYIFLVQ